MIRDFQDRIFQLCCEYSDFSQYLTNIGDLEKCPSKDIISDDYERMMMDSLFNSPNLDILAGIEHRSTITKQIMFRNLRYH